MKKLILSVSTIFILLACSSDDDNNTSSQCDISIEATQTAKQNFDSATEDNYTQVCNAYKAALVNQHQSCGDSDGSLQAMINDLGDCSDTPDNGVEGQISVTAGTLSIVFDVVSIAEEGGMIKVSGETSAANNYTIYFEVEENALGDDILEAFEINIISTYHPMESFFNSTVATNSSGNLSGSFNGVVENNDGGQLQLTNGNFDLNF